MSDAETTPKKKGGKMKKVLIATLGLVLIGGAGGAGGFYYAGAFGGDAAEEKPDHPKLVLKDGSQIDAPPGDGTGNLKDKAKYQVTYHPIEGSFTSNLRGGDSFAQAEIAVSTFYDERVVAALTEHDFAIRDAIVMELAESDRLQLETSAGKSDLSERLRSSVNEVLVEKTGFGGIDSIYFTKLVLQ
ncbi:MAG: flagellar basal body protein FliL [Sphingomonadales bacterium CG12_big_fil_rev_8_21_14_0_65_65_10]|nr:MAG: flagellar basal body protein FliL [Sphingomonadales bacterium CG12_big_fil_rev_8_21_14_0_65_65_10]